LFFHAGFSWAPGGFVGVDIFFVISGYLITRNIVYDIEAGKFSFKRFYIRRARRLLPALLFTLLVIFIVSLLLFTPVKLERVGAALLSALFSVSNFFFLSEAGYFDTASELKPLLHAWSLSVEEQFYLIWPALLVVLFGFKKTKVVVVLLILSATSSLYFSELLIATHPDTVFFMLPFRVFEFVIGALCVWIVGSRPKSGATLELLTTGGLALIIFSVVSFSFSLPFPGYRALLPCIGAALIICGGRAPFMGFIFRNRVAVGIGLISYSVYLAHWPLIVFYKYQKFTSITGGERVLLVAISILLGYLMWRFVETPFRQKRAEGAKRDRFHIWALSGVLLIAILGASAWLGSGFTSRHPAELVLTKEQIAAEKTRYGNYLNGEGSKVLLGSPGGKKIIIMGNSHAMDLIYSLKSNGSDANLTFLNSTGRCFYLGWSPYKEKDKEHCEVVLEKNLSDSNWGETEAVYLHDNWPKKGVDFGTLREAVGVIRRLTDAPIYFFGPKMTYDQKVFDTISVSKLDRSVNDLLSVFAMRDVKSAKNDSLKLALSRKEFRDKNIFYVDMLRTQCGERVDSCEIISTEYSNYLYFDTGHFTLDGATEFGRKLKKRYPELF
ncbi:MAG: acyltransferase family protein, partial [Thermodesulfobacteriota bacterium]